MRRIMVGSEGTSIANGTRPLKVGEGKCEVGFGESFF
jgi:hypothetical protein